MIFVHTNYIVYNSPVGELYIYFNDKAVTGLYFEDSPPSGCSSLGAPNLVAEQAISELNEYFQGTRRDFTIPTELHGTPFQKSVWEQLRPIPHGKTKAYADIAQEIGNPAAVRAVGGAIGKNPVSIIIPCHRVIGKNGSLTGFGGGLERKKWLLEHENFIH
jgi:methylated-DNA-[protein]-cysteine S-methyltransferase